MIDTRQAVEEQEVTCDFNASSEVAGKTWFYYSKKQKSRRCSFTNLTVTSKRRLTGHHFLSQTSTG